MRDFVGATTVAIPVVNEVTQGGIITAFRLEEAVLWGLTWGAWFKIGMAVALGLLIIERSISIHRQLKGKYYEH